MATVEIQGPGLPPTRELRVGDELILRLPENPTTGFRWQVNPSADPALRRVDDRFEPGSGSPLPGAGGTRVFTFAASSPGTVQLSLAHRQEWEPTGGTEQRLVIVIRG